MGMKLWLLMPREDLPETDDPWKPWFDKCFGMVVRAWTEEDARQMAREGEGNEVTRERNPWLDPAYSTCEELLAEGAADVIITNFHSA